MRTYLKKADEGEIAIYEEVLNPIADRYNRGFSTLILPKAVSVDRRRGRLALPYYRGQDFNDAWTEATGGSRLGLDLCVEAARVLAELATIDPSIVTGNERLRNGRRLVFDQAAYVSELPARLARFLDRGILGVEQARRATELLARPFASRMVLSNGDFYPRNFIRTSEGRIVLIDWETSLFGIPFHLVDYFESVAAVCFVHMWNNPAWQKAYVVELRKLAPMQKSDFQKGILIKSLRSATLWFGEDGRNDLCQHQVALFQSALTEEYMRLLWTDLDAAAE